MSETYTEPSEPLEPTADIDAVADQAAEAIKESISPEERAQKVERLRRAVGELGIEVTDTRPDPARPWITGLGHDEVVERSKLSRAAKMKIARQNLRKRNLKLSAE